MRYSYNGKFIAEETISDIYDPSEVKRSFYCNIYPEETDRGYNGTVFGRSVLRARITPVSMTEVRISGQNGIYKILKYDNEHLLLREKKKGRSSGKSFLIDSQVVFEEKLRISEE